jgi:biotin carboxylase
MKEQALVTASIIARIVDARGLPLETAISLRDKYLQKSAVRQAGVLVADCSVLEDVGELEECEIPLVIKPIAGGGSRLTALIRNQRDRRRFLSEVPQSERGPWLVEQVIDGAELHADGIVRSGVIVTMTVSRYLSNVIKVHEGALVGSVIEPRNEAAELYERALRLCSQSLAALRHHDGIFHLEMFEQPDGALIFSECAGRLGGGAILNVVRYQEGIDLAVEWAHSSLGLPATAEMSAVRRRDGTTGFCLLQTPVGVAKRVPELGPSAKWPGYVEGEVTLKPGMIMKASTDASDIRAGSVVIHARAPSGVSRQLRAVADWFRQSLIYEDPERRH